ncbi:hypothetical protein MCOR25_005581 [Pyricularia grisea]|nr:hypothetical protein MCOR25_005581 [Pyricularia grisea]
MSSPAVPANLTHHQQPETLLHQLISSINKISQDESFQQLQIILKDHEIVQEKLRATDSAYRKNLEELATLTAEQKAEKERLTKKILEQNAETNKALEDKMTVYRKFEAQKTINADLESTIKSLEQELSRAVAHSKKHEESVDKHKTILEKQKEQIAAAKKEVATATNKLKMASDQLGVKSDVLKETKRKLGLFQSYTVKLTPLELERGYIPEMLASLFKDASTLFEEFLGIDLDMDCLQELRSWERVRDHAATQHSFPLPASNSAPAKKMRVNMGLSIYSRALAKHVFRSNYLFPDAEEVLEALHAKDTLQGTLVRAVLLQVLPGMQKKRQGTFAKIVVDEVCEVVAGLMSGDLQKKFRGRLEQLTITLCGNWEAVQRVHERIRPSFALSEDDWKVLPVWSDSAPIPNGASQRSREDKDGQSGQRDPNLSTISTDDIARVVWPAFLATDEEGISELISFGYVISRDDVQRAANEDMPKRAMRKAKRDGDTGGERRRRDSAVFVSHGPSDLPKII